MPCSARCMKIWESPRADSGGCCVGRTECTDAWLPFEVDPYSGAASGGTPWDGSTPASGVAVPLVFFLLQFLWFLLAWSLIAYFVLWPCSARLSPAARLSAWIAPEMFRVLGVGLLVPGLSPGMPAEFAVSTAAGDSLTAMLAALAFTGLRQGWRAARGLAWACTVIGSLDILVAFPHAAATGAISHLAAQWYVPVFAGPMLVICHVACFILLVQSRRS
jgi:hypothetical protein